jgi:hypothetical protein
MQVLLVSQAAPVARLVSAQAPLAGAHVETLHRLLGGQAAVPVQTPV